MNGWQGGVQIEGKWQAGQLRVGIVAARFNEHVVQPLVQGAFEAWARVGGLPEHLALTWVPGAFELPLIARTWAEQGELDAVICLGAVIQGETPHFDYVCAQVASGIMQAGLATSVPVVFGVLTCTTVDQALARAGLKAGNKGADALLAAVEAAQVLAALRETKSKRK